MGHMVLPSVAVLWGCSCKENASTSTTRSSVVPTLTKAVSLRQDYSQCSSRRRFRVHAKVKPSAKSSKQECKRNALRRTATNSQNFQMPLSTIWRICTQKPSPDSFILTMSQRWKTIFPQMARRCISSTPSKWVKNIMHDTLGTFTPPTFTRST